MAVEDAMFAIGVVWGLYLLARFAVLCVNAVAYRRR